MSYLVVGLVALFASGLTLFSGFGLGTLLLPAFALFFPVEIAVAATAIVHLLNNLFKLLLVGRFAKPAIVARFGIPALAGALVGAWLLSRLAHLPELAHYTIAGRGFTVTGVGLTVGLLILVFAVIELNPSSRSVPAKWMPLGGALSGFFGGLSGHQGALRSLFLIQAGLTKEAFIGTGVACAVLVDLARLALYGSVFLAAPELADSADLVVVGTLCAFVGAFVGARLMPKVTLAAVQRLVGLLLVVLGLAIAAGLA